MEINSSIFLKLAQRLTPRASSITGILAVLIIGYTAWQIYQLLPDQPLNEDQIGARRLRVNQGQLNTFQSNLTSYRTPTPVDPVPTVQFSDSTPGR